MSFTSGVINFPKFYFMFRELKKKKKKNLYVLGVEGHTSFTDRKGFHLFSIPINLLKR